MEPLAYTVGQFLQAFPISRTSLYAAWSEGRGPKRIKIGRRTLIPVQAADEWMEGLLQAEEGGQ